MFSPLPKVIGNLFSRLKKICLKNIFPPSRPPKRTVNPAAASFPQGIVLRLKLHLSRKNPEKKLFGRQKGAPQAAKSGIWQAETSHFAFLARELAAEGGGDVKRGTAGLRYA
jgi:hypothetical protein